MTEQWTDRDEEDGIHIVPAYTPVEGEDLPTICVIPHSDRSEADARKILAVPALHEALSRLIGYCMDFAETDACARMDEKDDGEEVGLYRDELREYIERARKAMEKAGQIE